MYNYHPHGTVACVLTTGHLDGNPKNNSVANLRAFCQRCRWQFDHRRFGAVS